MAHIAEDSWPLSSLDSSNTAGSLGHCTLCQTPRMVLGTSFLSSLSGTFNSRRTDRKLASTSFICLQDGPLLLQNSRSLQNSRYLNVEWKEVMLYSRNNAANTILPSLKEEMSRAVLGWMHFCPTYLPLGELCHITKWRASFEFCVLPMATEPHIEREGMENFPSTRDLRICQIWFP